MSDIYNTLKLYDKLKDRKQPTEGVVCGVDGHLVDVRCKGLSMILRNLVVYGDVSRVFTGAKVDLKWINGVPQVFYSDTNDKCPTPEPTFYEGGMQPDIKEGIMDISGIIADSINNDIHMWAPIGQDGDIITEIHQMLPVGDILYVVGEFERIGGMDLKNIAAYDTKLHTWSDVGGGLPDMDVINAACVHGDKLYVGGEGENKLWAWDGEEWTYFPLWLIGNEGGAWNNVSPGVWEEITPTTWHFDGDAVVTRLVSDGETLFVATTATYIGEGTPVYVPPTPINSGPGHYTINGEYASTIVGSRSIFSYTGSLFTHKHPEYFGLWDQPIMTAINGQVYCAYTTDIDMEARGYIKKYENGAWVDVVVGFVSYDMLFMTPYNDTFLVFGIIGSSSSQRLMEWNGSELVEFAVQLPVLPYGISYPYYGITDVIADPQEPYFCGGFTEIGNNIAKCTTAWEGLGEGLNDTCKFMVFHGQNLYVSGDFTKAGGQDAYKIAVYLTGFEQIQNYQLHYNNHYNDQKNEVTWGKVKGEITDQPDLQSALGEKVSMIGDETVAGVKTFSSFPITPSAFPTSDYEVANKKYVDENGGGASAFTDLADVPPAYAGMSGKSLVVNASETGVEFADVTLPSLTGERVLLTDASGNVTTSPFLKFSNTNEFDDHSLVLGGEEVPDQTAPSDSDVIVNMVAKGNERSARMVGYVWGNGTRYPQYNGARSGGTRENKVPTPADATLVGYGAVGYANNDAEEENPGLGWWLGARIQARTTEIWSKISRGTAWLFFGNPKGTSAVPADLTLFATMDETGLNVPAGSDYKINGIPHDHPAASGAELDTGTDDAKFATAKALKDSHNVPSVAPGTSGNVLTSNGTDWTSAAPSGGVSDGDKGDITVSSGGAVWTIDNNAVTLAKLAAQGANTILANATTGSAVPAAVSVAEQTLLGRITGGNIAALSAAQILTLLGISISSYGTYTPTYSNAVNAEAMSTSYSNSYARVGNICLVSGRFTFNAADLASSAFVMPLPIASNFSGGSQCAGTAHATAYQLGWAISASTTYNGAYFQTFANDLSNRTYQFIFAYYIL